MALQNSHRHQVGWLTRSAIGEYVARGHAWLQEQNGEPCGYLLFGDHATKRPPRSTPTMKVIQCAIQIDARRRENASALIRDLEDLAQAGRFRHLALWCAEDLEANQFWQAIGFSILDVRIRKRTTRSDRPHLRWIKHLVQSQHTPPEANRSHPFTTASTLAVPFRQGVQPGQVRFRLRTRARSSDDAI